jgi:hypothetical protein
MTGVKENKPGYSQIESKIRCQNFDCSSARNNVENKMSFFVEDPWKQAPGVKQPVGETGGSTNRFIKKSDPQEHKCHCICELCKKQRGGATANYSQWHDADPVYP